MTQMLLIVALMTIKSTYCVVFVNRETLDKYIFHEMPKHWFQYVLAFLESMITGKFNQGGHNRESKSYSLFISHTKKMSKSFRKNTGNPVQLSDQKQTFYDRNECHENKTIAYQVLVKMHHAQGTHCLFLPLCALGWLFVEAVPFLSQKPFPISCCFQKASCAELWA